MTSSVSESLTDTPMVCRSPRPMGSFAISISISKSLLKESDPSELPLLEPDEDD